MNDNDFELKAYTFVPQIIEIRDESFKKFEDVSLKGSLSTREITDLSDLINNSIAIVTQYFSDLSDRKIFIFSKGIRYGFSELNYKEFYEFIYQFNEHKGLSDLVSIEYLKEKVLIWIVDIYKNKFSKEGLLNYLNRLVDDDVKKYSFYYPILNLEVDEEFSIGDAKITYFTKEYFEQLFQEKKSEGISEDDFNKLYKKYLGQVFVCVEVIAEKRLASKLASEKASYIVDVLKLTSPTVVIPFEKCFLELASKMPSKFDFLSFKEGNKFGLAIHEQVNRCHQISYTAEMINGYMPIYDQFGGLFHSKVHLEILVKNSIIFYSKCISEDDLHLRISKFIMILESIFLRDTEIHGMVQKCKARFLNFRNISSKNSNDKLELILDNMYQIRHKMTHKSIRLYIDNYELQVFQGELVQILFSICEKATLFNDKNMFLDYLDEI
ncbi:MULTISPECIES: hypothetical protein [Chryseobacterium]|uniref:hypothetical protein n=1 Tax=Chryseobacterium TaxID=59732 RepID=UPI000481F46D|nr:MULTISPECIES: hypothetical protein [Chryseobacterium]